jgi:putative hemolysin
MPHIVDTLIEERAAGLMRKRLLWSTLKPVLYPMLGYRRAIPMADALAPLAGFEGLQYLSGILELDVRCQGLEHIPRQGLAVVVANHPSGIGDGIALFDALKRRCAPTLPSWPTGMPFACRPGMADVIVPVEWMTRRRNVSRQRETVRADGAGVPRATADRDLSVRTPGAAHLRGLVEREWESSALNLAMKYRAPVTPVHISGRNSWLYYLFYAIHHELRDMTLFRELLNKRGRSTACASANRSCPPATRGS